MKARVAIIGSANIGTDLMIKLMRLIVPEVELGRRKMVGGRRI